MNLVKKSSEKESKMVAGNIEGFDPGELGGDRQEQIDIRQTGPGEFELVELVGMDNRKAEEVSSWPGAYMTVNEIESILNLAAKGPIDTDSALRGVAELAMLARKQREGLRAITEEEMLAMLARKQAAGLRAITEEEMRASFHGQAARNIMWSGNNRPVDPRDNPHVTGRRKPLSEWGQDIEFTVACAGVSLTAMGLGLGIYWAFKLLGYW